MAHVTALTDDAELDRPRPTNWGELRPTRWIVAAMITHDAYHAGEINHLRSLLGGSAASDSRCGVTRIDVHLTTMTDAAPRTWDAFVRPMHWIGGSRGFGDAAVRPPHEIDEAARRRCRYGHPMHDAAVSAA